MVAEQIGKNVWFEPDLNELFGKGINKKCEKCKNFSREVLDGLCPSCREKEKDL